MLTNNDNDKVRLSSAVWSPDEKQIAYISREQLEVKKVKYGISALSNGEPKNFFESNSLVRLLGWTQNGNEILAAVANDNEIELMKISTISKSKPLTLINLKGVYIQGMTLSPDGQKVAYSARRDGVNNVFVIFNKRKGRKIDFKSRKYSVFFGNNLVA